ncbi:MAG TPA: hypothetical protein VHQ65_09565 [Thermoanaerobaculia bacterium]|nr:hypothetical protein [Thermoanaerobaculia bacterium]
MKLRITDRPCGQEAPSFCEAPVGADQIARYAKSIRLMGKSPDPESLRIGLLEGSRRPQQYRFHQTSQSCRNAWLPPYTGSTFLDEELCKPT